MCEVVRQLTGLRYFDIYVSFLGKTKSLAKTV